MLVPLVPDGGWLVAIVREVALWGGVLLLVASALSFYHGWKRRQASTLVEETPRVDVADVQSSDVVHVRGTVAPQSHVDTFRSPVTDDSDCLLAAWGIEEMYDTPKTKSWERSAWGVQAVPFYVEDETGRVLVDVEDRVVGNETDDVFTPESILASDGVSFEGLWCEFDSFDVGVETDYDETPPRRLAEFLDRTDGVSAEPMATDLVVDACKRKYSEQTLQPGDEISVLGHASPRQGSASVGHPDDAVLTQSDEATLRLSTRPLDELSDGGGGLLFGVFTGVVGVGLLAATTVL